MSVQQPPGIAVFDSATGFLRALARFLRGEDFPAVGQHGLAPKLAPLANHLPGSLREKAFAAGRPTEAVDPDRIEDVDAERIARWIVDLYPRRRYPAIMIGSSNGALTHACALLGIPWLPQTFLTLVRQDHPDADDAMSRSRRPARSERAC